MVIQNHSIVYFNPLSAWQFQKTNNSCNSNPKLALKVKNLHCMLAMKLISYLVSGFNPYNENEENHTYNKDI